MRSLGRELQKIFAAPPSSLRRSLPIYIAYYHGEQYTRTMNGFATEYFLTKIYNVYGPKALTTALDAISKHIEYYENLDHGKLNNIREIYNKFVEISKNSSYENIYSSEETNIIFKKGNAKDIILKIYERDRNARKKCIEYYGYKCSVCGSILSDFYGPIAIEYIHIHHLIELSNIKREYTVDPIKDLRPLCPNCHAMIHRKTPAYSIEELREIIKKYR